MSSRTRGLWWKEWRQLRMLRLTGAVLIVVAPLILLAGAEAGKRGWMPFYSVQVYTSSTVVQDALPMFLGFLVWPLLALMFVSQSFAGDVAAGTEWFWKERPVKPRRVWLARIAASLTSLLSIVALHWLVWRSMVTLWGNPDAIDSVGKYTRWILMKDLTMSDSGTAMGFGLLVALVMFAAALAATPLTRSPMQAIPLGLILAALPLGLSQLFRGLFPYLGFNEPHLPALIPLLLFPVYLIASYLAACRGEPAGRGKLKRGFFTIGVAVIAVVALALPAGVWATRRIELIALGEAVVRATPDGERVFAFNERQSSGWLFDADSGKELLHLDPFVLDAAWDAAGERLAVTRIDEVVSFVLEVYDREGSPIIEGIACEERCFEVAWSGDRILVPSQWTPGLEIRWIDPVTGETALFEIEQRVMFFDLLGPLPDGRHLMARQTCVMNERGRCIDDKDGGSKTLELYSMQPGADPDDEPSVVVKLDRFYRLGRLSPDGSALLAHDNRRSVVIRLPDGRITHLGTQAVWLHPSRPAWATRDGENIKVLVEEEGTVREIGHFEGHGAMFLQGSPGGRRLLFIRDPNVSSPGGLKKLEHWLYDADAENWSEAEHCKVYDANGWPTARLQWIDDNTMALSGYGMLALCDPAVPGSLRYLLGG